MSSYLNIYVQNRKTKEKELLTAYSRNTELYEALHENLQIPYMDNYLKVEPGDFEQVINTVKTEKTRTENRITELEKHANGNLEIIEEILRWKEYLDEKTFLINELEVFSYMLSSFDFNGSTFDEMYINIG